MLYIFDLNLNIEMFFFKYLENCLFSITTYRELIRGIIYKHRSIIPR